MASIDLSAFPPEREEKLKSIYRYSMFEVMYYRSNLWQHSHRVSWIVDQLLPLCEGMDIDGEKARVLAMVHDDTEMVIGDIPAGHKSKMDADALKAIESSEENAAQELREKYRSWSMGTTILSCKNMQFIKTASKRNWYRMRIVLTRMVRRSMRYTPGIFHLSGHGCCTSRWIATFTTKYPALAPLLAHDSPWIIANAQQQPRHIYPADYALMGKPHTSESIRIPTEFPYYNVWRNMILEKEGEEGERFLTEQKEGLLQK